MPISKTPQQSYSTNSISKEYHVLIKITETTHGLVITYCNIWFKNGLFCPEILHSCTDRKYSFSVDFVGVIEWYFKLLVFNSH